MRRTLVQERGRTKKPKVWSVEVEDNRVLIEWGQLDGKMQHTVQEFEGVSIGKSNEKSPHQVATEFAERQALKKEREGYLEEGAQAQELKIDFTQPLPQSLRFYKPQNSMNAYMEKLCTKGYSWYVRKRNGEMVVIVVNAAGEINFYSSKLLLCHKDEPGIPWADRFPHLVAELESANIPPGSILLGELVADKEEDNLLAVGSVMKSLTERALELQKEKPLCLCIWDIAFWDYQDWVSTLPYERRNGVLHELAHCRKFEYITEPDIVTGGTPEYWKEDAKRLSWEGYVVVDPAGIYGDRAYNFAGKAERPKQCCKLKPTYEADFIVRWDPDNEIGTWGRGKKKSGVGAVFAYLWDPEKQEEVYISKVGGGLSDEDVFRFADPSLYPMVWQVEFASWTDHGSLQFPQFVRVREDKTPQECTIDQRP